MGIPRETKRITYSSEIRAMKHVVLSGIQQAIVVGSLLGDANLCANWSKTNYRMQVRHSQHQEEYVWWKYNQLKEIVITPPKVYEPTRCVHFRTVSHPTLTVLHKIFYSHGKKMITAEMQHFIEDPVVVAVWFMDDGNVCRHNNNVYGYHLNTQSFSQSENQSLQTVFGAVWGLRCTVQKNNGYYRLYFGAEEADDFRALIQPHIIPTMRYKLG